MAPPISGNRPPISVSSPTPVAAPPRPVAPPATPTPRRPADSFTPSTRIETRNGNTGVDTARGTIPAAAWKSPEKVLGNLTQNPHGSVTGNMNCGPAGMLGGAIMQGQAPTAALLNQVAQNPAYAKLTPEDRTQLKAVAAGVTNGTATFEDLNAAQSLLYKAGNTDGTDGFTTAELVELAPKGKVDTLLMPKNADGNPDLNAVLKQLKPGDSAMVVVEGDMRKDATPHFITIGKTPDGKPFVYNPDPDVSDQNPALRDSTLVTGDAAVRSQLNAYQGRLVTDRPELMDVVIVHPK